jgi:hypothetical protein
MDLNVFTAAELQPALRALKGVALANGSVTEPERQLLEMVAELNGSTVDVAALAPIASAEVASAIAGEHQRKRLIQLSILTAMTDGEVTPAQSAAVQELARAVGYDERGLRVLHDFAAQQLLLVRYDFVRRAGPTIFGQLWEDHGFSGIRKFAAAIVAGRGKADPELAWRYKQLGLLPAGTLGRAYWEFATRRKFLMPGEMPAVVEGFVYHDFGHVLSGYDTNPEGEARIAAFQAGYRRDDGFAFLLMIMVGGHLGVKINPNLTARGLFEPRAVLRALARGTACKVDLSDRWNHWEHVERPLEEVRREFGIEPVEPGPGVQVV